MKFEDIPKTRSRKVEIRTYDGLSNHLDELVLRINKMKPRPHRFSTFQKSDAEWLTSVYIDPNDAE